MRIFFVLLCFLFSSTNSSENLRKLQTSVITAINPTYMNINTANSKSITIIINGDCSNPFTSVKFHSKKNEFTFSDSSKITCDYNPDIPTDTRITVDLSSETETDKYDGEYTLTLIAGDTEVSSAVHTIVIYQNEVELPDSCEITLPISTHEIPYLSIPLNYPIITEQIKTITIGDQSHPFNYDSTLQIMNSETEKLVFNSASNQTITVNFINARSGNCLLTVKEGPKFTIDRTVIFQNSNDEETITITAEKTDIPFKVKHNTEELTETPDNTYSFSFLPDTVTTSANINDFSITYLVDVYEYPIDTIKVLPSSFTDTFETINSFCSYNNFPYEITPTLKTDTTQILEQNQLKVEITKDNSPLKEKDTTFSDNLSVGSYKVNFYYGEDTLDFYHYDLEVLSPVLSTPLYINHNSNKLSFALTRLTCEILEDQTYTLYQEGEPAKSLDLTCHYASQTLSCELTNEWKSDYGNYALKYGDVILVDTITVSDWDLFSISIGEEESGSKKVTITPSNSEDTSSIATVTKVTFQQITEGGNTPYTVCASDCSATLDNPNNIIEISLPVSNSKEYYLESIESADYKKTYQSNEHVIKADITENNNYSIKKDIFVIQSTTNPIEITLVFEEESSASSHQNSIYVNNAMQTCDISGSELSCRYTIPTDLVPSSFSVKISESDENPKPFYIITYSLSSQCSLSEEVDQFTITLSCQDSTVPEITLKYGNEEGALTQDVSFTSGTAIVAAKKSTVGAQGTYTVYAQKKESSTAYETDISITVKDAFSITNVSTLKTSTEAQTLSITFSSINSGEITAIKLKPSTNGGANINCNSIELAGSVLSCSAIVSEADTYTIVYTTACGVDIESTSTVLSGELIKSIDKEIIELEKETDQFEITIEFLKEFN